MGKVRNSAILAAILFGAAGSFGVLHSFTSIDWISRASADSGLAEPGASGPVVSNPFQGTVPPAWDAAKAEGVAGIFTSCGTSMAPTQSFASGMMGTSMMGGAGGGGLGSAQSCPMAMGASISTVCAGSDTPPDIAQLNCQTVGMNPMAIQQMTMLLQQAECTDQCKKNKLLAVMGEINCITNQAQALNNQIGSLTNVYNTNILRMQKDVALIQSAQDDRAAQLKDVTQKLQGNGEGGTPGLLQLQQKTLAMINAMPAQIQQINVEYQQTVQSQRALDEQIQIRTMSLTMDCFDNRTVDSYRCAPNGPPVTPKAYLLCRFQQNQNLGANGMVEQNSVTRAQAQAGDQGLGALLDQMAGDTSSNPNIPVSNNNNQDEMLQNMQSPLQELSVADVQNLYGNQLSKYTIGGTNADAFVMAIMKSCNDRATREVQLETERANTIIGQGEYQIKLAQQKTNTDILGLYSTYSQQFSDDMSGLVGLNVPLNTSQCAGAATQVQIQCLNNIRTTMQGMMNGTAPNATMAGQVKGNNSATDINFKCQGLNGCVTTLQNITRNIQVSQTQLDNFKKLYIVQANQSTEMFTKQVASQLNGQSQMLNTQLLSLNTALASLGFGGGINLPKLQGEQFQYDKDGLVKDPTNVLNLVGQYVNPPLPDLSGNGLAGAMGGVSQAQQQLDSNYAVLNSDMIQVANMQQSCMYQANQNVLSQAGAAQNCYASPYCQEGTDQAQELATAMSGVLGNPGLAGTTGLSNGMNSVCDSNLVQQYKTLNQNLTEVGSYQTVDGVRQQTPEYEQMQTFQNSNQSSGCAQYFATIIGVNKNLQQLGGNGGMNSMGAGGAFGH